MRADNKIGFELHDKTFSKGNVAGDTRWSFDHSLRI